MNLSYLLRRRIDVGVLLVKVTENGGTVGVTIPVQVAGEVFLIVALIVASLQHPALDILSESSYIISMHPQH